MVTTGEYVDFASTLDKLVPEMTTVQAMINEMAKKIKELEEWKKSLER